MPDSNEPKRTVTAEDKQRRQESLKLLYDWFKHLTTLSTGTVLISAALSQRFFDDPQHFWLFGLSTVLLFVSLGASIISMVAVIIDVRKPYTGPGTPESTDKQYFLWSFAVAWGCFLVGVGMFLWFTSANVW